MEANKKIASLSWARAVLVEAGWIFLNEKQLAGAHSGCGAIFANMNYTLELCGATVVGPKAFFIATEANIIAQAEAEAASRLENLEKSHALA